VLMALVMLSRASCWSQIIRVTSNMNMLFIVVLLWVEADRLVLKRTIDLEKVEFHHHDLPPSRLVQLEVF
jgi:hypothetical protein